jgi:hypothetical protein
MRHPATILISILATTSVVLGLQTAQKTETIAGIVMRADTRTPLSDVRLELVPEDYERITTGYEKPCRPEPGNALSATRRFVTTDKTGKFTFTEIVPGTYYLYAEREGFLKYAYGQLNKFPIPVILRIGVDEQGENSFSSFNGIPPPPRETTRNVPAGATVDYRTLARVKNTFQDMELALTPAPAITGRVVSEQGSPLTAASTQLYQFRYTPLNGKSLKSVRGTLTDDAGNYRLFWLDPGRYFVAAGFSEYGLQPWNLGLTLTPNLPSADAGYPVTFYPSATSAPEAVYVPLNPGTQPLVDVRLRSRTRLTTRIRLTGNSIPGNANLIFTPAGGDLCAAQDYGISAKKDDAVEVRDVPEGLYVAAVMSGRDFVSDLYTIKVEKGGPADHTIPVNTATTVWGTVYLDDMPGGSALRGARVNLTRTRRELRQASTGVPDLKTGKFSIPGLGPGSYYPTLDLPPGFYVDNISASKHDQLDPEKCSSDPGSLSYMYMDAHGHLDGQQPIVIPTILPNDAECLAIIVKFGGSFFGYVYDRVGKPMPGALVVAIPMGIWAKSADAGVTPADRMLITTSDSDGRFELQGTTRFVNPQQTVEQQYRLYAFEGIDPNEIWDPGIEDRFHGHEGFETRVYVFENSQWVVKRITTPTFAKFGDCNQDSIVARNLCFLTAIPATETAEIK